jgi:vancomycin resistance protein YoaR
MHSVYPLSSPSVPSVGFRRSLLDFAGLLIFLLLLVMLIGGALWHFWFVNRIYYGISVAGVPVGGMTRATALRTLEDYFADNINTPVSLSYGGQYWPLVMNQVPVEADLMAAVNQAYLVGRQGDFSNKVASQLVTVIRGYNVIPPLQVDEAQLRMAIAQLASEVNQPGRPADQIGDVLIPAVPAVTVDVEATTQATLAALRNSLWHETITAPFIVNEQTPVMTATLPELDATEAATLRPVRLRNQEFGLEFALDTAMLSKLVSSIEPFAINEAAVTQLLEGWATQIDREPRDARLRFNRDTGGLTVIQTSAHGRMLDQEATRTALVDALRNGESQAELAVNNVAPAVDGERIAELGIRELIASGTTYFKGSSAERVRNIEVAAEQFDGVVIPPNGIFSFNKIVENVTSANGFEDSLVIYGDQTVVGVGGGVCQVSTTVFRAAYAAGMPIVERYNHGYIVDWYGEPGLDAAIYTPTVDFRFRNDTGAYLLIEPVVDTVNGVLTFNLYGTKPNRVVTIGTPVKSDIRQPEPATFTVDTSLAPGQRKQVEWEKPGMTVTVQRTIVEDGTTRTDTLTSHYVPWRAQYLVGPGSDVPTTPLDEAEASANQPL